MCRGTKYGYGLWKGREGKICAEALNMEGKGREGMGWEGKGRAEALNI